MGSKSRYQRHKKATGQHLKEKVKVNGLYDLWNAGFLLVEKIKVPKDIKYRNDSLKAHFMDMKVLWSCLSLYEWNVNGHEWPRIITFDRVQPQITMFNHKIQKMTIKSPTGCPIERNWRKFRRSQSRKWCPQFVFQSSEAYPMISIMG